jgi:pimeloyl-ACP methyl ester carboxylesterase
MERIPIRTDEELASLKMPVQLIVGAKDAMIRSEETRDRVRRLVPHAHVSYLEAAGHLLPPQTRTIAEFVTATSCGRAIA